MAISNGKVKMGKLLETEDTLLMFFVGLWIVCHVSDIDMVHNRCTWMMTRPKHQCAHATGKPVASRKPIWELFQVLPRRTL